MVNSDVVGVGKYSSDYSDNIVEKIEDMMNGVVKKIRKD